MNEYIEIAFKKPNGSRWRVLRQTVDGIVFDEPDPIERTIGIQISGRSEATKFRMRRIGQIKGWELGQFRVRVSVEDGNMTVRGDDPDALPEGNYRVQVEVEEAHTQQRTRNVDIDQDGHGTLDVVVTKDERDVEVNLADCEGQIERVLGASTIDGMEGPAWLDGAWRPTRKACLLNVLASLRSRPTLADVLIDEVHQMTRVFNDRVYAKVDRGLLPRLERLAKDERRPFYREGEPRAKIHHRLLESVDEPPDVKAGFQGLLSFRGEGSPSLQMVVAVPPVALPYTYAEFDLDLGNPLQDLLGFVVHMGELLDGKPTNHLDMRKALAKTSAGRFLYYEVKETG